MATKKKDPYKYKPAGLEYLKGYGPGTPTWAGPNVTTAAAPAAPAPTYSAPDIRDASYNDVINGAWRNLGDVTAGVAGQQALLRGRYGYADNNFTIDPTNPFGQAQLLTRSYNQSKAGTQNSYAARGQETSGAYGRQQNANLFDYQQRNDALQKSFLSDNANLLSQLTAAQGAYRDTAAGAAGDALQRALAARSAPQVNTAAAGNVSAHGPIVSSGVDSKGRKYNIHADGYRATIK